MKFAKVWNWAQKIETSSSIYLGHLYDSKEWILVVNNRIQREDNTSKLGFSDWIDLSLASPFTEVKVLKIKRLTEENIPDYIMTKQLFGKILIEGEVVLDLKEFTAVFLGSSYDWYNISRKRIFRIIEHLEHFGLKVINGKIDWKLTLKNFEF